MTKKEKDEKENKEEVFFYPELPTDPSMRTVSIYGEINEERASVIVSSLTVLKEMESPAISPDKDFKNEPLKIIVSSEGGNVQDMFAIYDCMRYVRQDCEIQTFGLGKVMSAGILLLSAGTKGKRRVGKHCRMMMHSVQGAHYGSIKELETDITEVRWYQEQFIEALSHESSLDHRQIKDIFSRKTDTYFDANQALEWGIVDEIV